MTNELATEATMSFDSGDVFCLPLGQDKDKAQLALLLEPEQHRGDYVRILQLQQELNKGAESDFSPGLGKSGLGQVLGCHKVRQSLL